MRTSTLPVNSVILDTSTDTVPSGFTQHSASFDRYPRGIPDLCTQPGGNIGSNCHSESSTGAAHTHDGAFAHTHILDTGISICCEVNIGTTLTVNPNAHKNHIHSWTSNSGSPCATTGSTAHSHTHTCTVNEPEFQTTRFLQKNVINMRSSHVPIGKNIFYSKTVASLPSEFSVDSCFVNNKFIKSVLDACTSPGSTGGGTSHQHATNTSCHIHTFSVPSHTHGKPTNVNNKSCGSEGGATDIGLHDHSTSSITIASATGSGCTGNDSTHQHASTCHIPLHRELLPIRNNVISMRKTILPVGSVLLWYCNLSLIPDGWQVADGSNGTLCTLDRYARLVCGPCTNPGTGAGSLTHQHAGSTHTHSGAHAHSHTQSGSYPADVSPPLAGGHSGTPPANAEITHTHGAGGTSTCPSASITVSGGCHQHTATNNQPLSIRVAFIERI